MATFVKALALEKLVNSKIRLVSSVKVGFPADIYIYTHTLKPNLNEAGLDYLD